VQIDPELEQLRPLFLRTVYDFQSQIADAITGNDFQTLQRCGHSLKGLGSTYGVDEISQAGRLIEAAAKERQTAIVAEAANHLAIFMNTGQTPKIQAEDKALPTTPEANLDGDRFVVHVAPDMSELIPFLMEGMQKDLIGMRQASVDQDFAALRRSGHDLKGFGTTYGFDYMLFLGSQIQLAADKQSAGEIARLLNILEDYLNRVDIIYDGGESLRDTDRPDSLSAQATVAEDSASTDSASTIVEVDQELYELVPLFLETMEKNIAEMDEALKYKQYEVICRHGHSQRGLGSTYGFDYIGDLGSKLELAGAQKDDNTISVLLEQMNEYLQKVHVVQKEG
jgi:HPt (histidine-containing phosphotransfer) domain-containing protein